MHVSPEKSTRRAHTKKIFSHDMIHTVFYLLFVGGLLAALVFFLPKEPLGTAALLASGHGGFTGATARLSQLRLTEIMSSNRNAFPDQSGAFLDWIEITNQGDEALSILGYGLSDDDAQVRFTFPDRVLAPGESVVVFADNTHASTVDQAFHAKFKISALGETIYLFDAQARIIDQVVVPALDADIAYAHITTGWVQTSEYTPGYPNTKEGLESYRALVSVDASPILLTEMMASNHDSLVDENGEYVDWIELYNRGSEPVDLSQFALSDDPTTLIKWRFPPNIILQPGAYYVVYASGKDRIDTPILHTNFRLSAEHETVLLSDVRGHILDQTTLDNLKPDTVWMRNIDLDIWAVSPTGTPGKPNF